NNTPTAASRCLSRKSDWPRLRRSCGILVTVGGRIGVENGFHRPHRVIGGGHPPPIPTERSVRISRTTLFSH
ncbi:MAG: hypothetical protein WC856_25720, partial [Methylococcaceae bacterium]